ncbi:cell division protein SepF [Fructilactobacillus fructivorans]|uniref:Cell division protein SepF n=1 Tax=Fructilactobacillus fructivorans TaxID=1614 RepID=A0AAE6P1M5_9LACO|nr:cell division protein SepF [Fructilactobacillus fructivorans]KRK58820.1 cell division protein [Fructilactobacillus fructivorans]KRN13731.1 cell division protein [Fructilactobacillus fructivorans]QFX92813.1 DUF552 domain-containing protein [Fructilactobacillus fructivorans]RDV65595.1 DUF552 domain-containing protein [Fructilactobacillus fructivorans]
MSNKIKKFLGLDDDDEAYENDETSQNTVPSVKSNPRKVVSMSQSDISNSKIAILEPRIYADAKSIASKLIGGNAVIVKMDGVSNESVKRIVDFLNGTVYAIDGKIKRIDDKIFLCAPNNFDIDGAMDEKFNSRLG